VIATVGIIIYPREHHHRKDRKVWDSGSLTPKLVDSVVGYILGIFLAELNELPVTYPVMTGDGIVSCITNSQ
jgi:hypothetical protein